MRNNCYRYTAPDSLMWQSYLGIVPWMMYEGKPVCVHFWDKNER